MFSLAPLVVVWVGALVVSLIASAVMQLLADA